MNKTTVNTPAVICSELDAQSCMPAAQAAEIFERVLHRENGLSVSGLAREYSITPGKMRSMLTQHFGSRIHFHRGRNGGISVDK